MSDRFICSKYNNVLLWIDERKKAISLRPSLGRVGQESEKLDQFRMIDASHVASDQTSRGLGIALTSTLHLQLSPRTVMSSPESSASSSSSQSSSSNSIFKRWSKTFGVITGIGMTEEERTAELEAHHGRTCDKWKREMMNYSQY